MGSEVEVTSCSNDKREKTCFKWNAFLTDYISTCKSEMAFMGLDFQADTPRIKAGSTVMMADL